MRTDSKLINYLHQEGIIDKRIVLWWQLGFEGRKVWDKLEFEKTLVTQKHLVHKIENGEHMGEEEKSFQFWPRDDVPILLKDVNIKDNKVPCFCSVKPLSHETHSMDWLAPDKNESRFAPSIYLSPHIRGAVIELTEEFLFWSPFLFGEHRNVYSSNGWQLPNEQLPIILSPIEPAKFYKNLIEKIWNKGKRPQTKATERSFDLDKKKIVPYYEFNPKLNQATIYPGKVFPGKMDLPIILSGEGGRIPQILGTGWFHYSQDIIAYHRSYINNDAVAYWVLNRYQERNVRDSLIKRLGKIE